MKTKELLERLERLEERMARLEGLRGPAVVPYYGTWTGTLPDSNLSGGVYGSSMGKCPKCLEQCYKLLIQESDKLMAGPASKKKVKGWSRG